MIKYFCDNCKKEMTEIKSIQVDIFDVDEPTIDIHEVYHLDLCPNCHSLFRKLVKDTNVEPIVNPYG